MLLFELCLYAPFSNATLERFFSQMRKELKLTGITDLVQKLITLRIKVEDSELKEFSEKCCGAAVNCWYNDKLRLNQRK